MAFKLKKKLESDLRCKQKQTAIQVQSSTCTPTNNFH